MQRPEGESVRNDSATVFLLFSALYICMSVIQVNRNLLVERLEFYLESLI
jgi:hypothetical protein